VSPALTRAQRRRMTALGTKVDLVTPSPDVSRSAAGTSFKIYAGGIMVVPS